VKIRIGLAKIASRSIRRKASSVFSSRVALVLGVGPAVDTGVSAGAGHFPGDGKGRLGEIGVHHVLVVQAALGGGAVA
jgi:hypothetical protein